MSSIWHDEQVTLLKAYIANPSIREGICSTCKLSSDTITLMKEWPHHSGNRAYPIYLKGWVPSHTEVNGMQRCVYDISASEWERQYWAYAVEGTKYHQAGYLALRLDLARFVLKALEAKDDDFDV